MAKFKKGDKVKWNDPAIADYPEEDREEQANIVYTIADIRGDIIDLEYDGMYTEVLEDEIYKV